MASRVFGFTNSSSEKTDALIPFGDLINPGAKNVNWKFNFEKKTFEFSAIKEIKKGESIRITFGKKCNTRFLINYGFIEENNMTENELEIYLELDENDVFLREKKAVLELEEDDSNVTLKMKWKVDDFLQVLFKTRILLAENISDIDKTSLKTIENLDLERKSIDFLKNLLMERRGKYPMSYEEDENLLKIAGLSLNEINCIKSRMGEKELINSYIKALKALGDNFNQFGIKIETFNKLYFEVISLFPQEEY